VVSDETRLQEIRERCDQVGSPLWPGLTESDWVDDVLWLLSLVERLQRERNHECEVVDSRTEELEAAEAALADAREALRQIADDCVDQGFVAQRQIARAALAAAGEAPGLDKP